MSMRIYRSTSAGGHTVLSRRRVAQRPVPEPTDNRANYVSRPQPLDWEQAVRAAASRLNETWVLSDTAGHPVMADLAQRLAALLCAYGEMPKEVERMQARSDILPIAAPTATPRAGLAGDKAAVPASGAGRRPRYPWIAPRK
jgi:hypothetical protein